MTRGKLRTARSIGRVIAVTAIIGSLVLSPAVASGAEQETVRTTFPSMEDPGPPLYARVGDPAGPTIYNDGEWAVIVFYRNPDCVPDDFNLLEFFAFDSFACEMSVSGHSIWEVEVGSAPPKVHKTFGSDVPVWFLPIEVANQAIGDGVLTVPELEALPELVVGSADRFNEVLHPEPLPPEFGAGGHPSPKLVQNAKGTLEDGHRFSVHLTAVASEIQAISIDFR